MGACWPPATATGNFLNHVCKNVIAPFCHVRNIRRFRLAYIPLLNCSGQLPVTQLYLSVKTDIGKRIGP